MNKYLSIDIGASSGRHIVGWYENGTLQTEEVYRFQNGMETLDGHLTWNITNLENAVIEGIAQAKKRHPEIVSLAIDTWGVDYVLLNGDQVIPPCFAYRDHRTEEVFDDVHSVISPEELYAHTGIQFQTFNSIYQLYVDLKAGRLQNATDYLLMPEYLTYRLTGIKIHEYTNATTMGLVNAKTGKFDQDIIHRLGLPHHLFGEILPPGTIVGKLKSEIEALVGGNIAVLLCASHDTASAIAAIPMEDTEVYLSSGTWSLLGIKEYNPNTTEDSRRSGYSNEGGTEYICYLKNIMGMWIINNLRAELCPNTSFDIITKEAQASDFDAIVNINDDCFFAPSSMKAAFDNYLQHSLPLRMVDYFRCALRSLAFGYRDALSNLAKITKRTFSKLYVVGGGAKNNYLNQLIQEICHIQVIALPIEATSMGSLLIQANKYESRT